VGEIRSADQPTAVIALTHSSELSDRLAALGIESVIDRSQGLGPLLAAIQTYVDLEKQSQPVQTIQVLVVDDEPDTLKMLSSALEQWGYSVLTAKDGNQALQVVERNPKVALVLLDVLIPGRGGMEVLKEIRTHNPEVEVVILTGISDREVAHQAITLGAFDYITKPLDLPALQSIILACFSHKEYKGRPWWQRLIGASAITKNDPFVLG